LRSFDADSSQSRHGFTGILESVYAAGPRVEQGFLERVAKLDDSSEPMAETYRRIRSLANEQGIPRPSYERIRRQLNTTRLRPDERKRARTLVFELAYNTRQADHVVADLLRLLE
jgi:hypothetical protein